jgi:PAS domain S-box-containing protein
VNYPEALQDRLGLVERELHRLQEVLEASARDQLGLADFFENAAMPQHWVGPDGTILRANQAELDLLGYSREEYIGRQIADFHADQPVIQDILRRLGNAEVLHDCPARLRCKDGSIRDVLITSRVYRQDGRFIHTRCLTRDITDLKRAEQALQDNERHFREMIDALPAAVYTTDAEGRLTYFNPAAVAFSGRVPELGTDHWCVSWKMYRPDGTPLPHDECPMAVALKEGCLPRGVEAIAERPDGTRIWFEPYPTPLRDAEGRIVGGINMLVDITERKRAEAALRASDEHLRDVQRIESVGRLAGGVAHEVNNQMTVALGCADYLLRRHDLPPAALSDVRHIREAAERSAAITQQLLAFGRRQLLRPQVVDLNDLVTRLSPVLRRTLGPDVAVELRLAPSACSVVADGRQLQQVMINLALNARDAMPEGGTLRVETSRAVLPDGVTYCLLVVSDTGCGMDRETLGRIFEPFFTTKPFGQGTGLGLSSVHGIVKQSEGDIVVESVPGRGTTFSLYFPSGAALPAEGSPAAVIESPAHSATVLVAEDDDGVRAMIRRALCDEGHRVLEVADGQEAIHLLAQPGTAIDLLLADLAMPRVGGLELSERLAQLRPGVPTLFISGYPWSEMIERGMLKDGLPFLNKPFSPDDLALRVRQLLNAKAERNDA